MNGQDVLAPGSDRRAGYKVDVSRGERNGRVSSEWFKRPDDERFLSLDDLWTSVKGRSERSRTRIVDSAAIRVEASREDGERLHLALPGGGDAAAPTHWAFGQLAGIVGAPAAYLRPPPWQQSTCNMVCPPTGPSRSRPWRPPMAGPSCGR